MAQFCSGVPVSYDGVTVSQHAQYQDPETKAAKWNSAIFNFYYLYLFFSTVTSRDVLVKTAY